MVHVPPDRIDDARRVDPSPDYPDREWMPPGGHPEVDERPAAAAARELREETTHRGRPGRPPAVRRRDLAGRRGETRAGAAVRGHANCDGGRAGRAERRGGVAGLAADDFGGRETYRRLYDEPARYREPSGLVPRARAALAEHDGT